MTRLTPRHASRIARVAIILGTLITIVIITGRGRQMQHERRGGFQWKPFEPETLDRFIEQGEEAKNTATRRTSVEMAIHPQHEDPKLDESWLFIETRDATSETVLYAGPFTRKIMRSDVPHAHESTSLFLWAFHRDSGTFLSWKSLESWPVFTGKPMILDLYDEYRDDAGGWFRLRSAAD
ncbi:hypothetical protein [Chondromyces crocatus]|uniref:Uncharacterized protein n=1 Tax=Chondromyces crocatus TaxID=52 RepID=A0A0K1EJE1_CHOCO|nr:hypothetical protein [Chondromyces crocatus]AKT40792.1 uncharacterized protein CMC5_049480 [Chondromyces crocatus]